MTGRVEFFALSAEIEKMLQQGHSVRYVFDYFSMQNQFTQSYQTFLRYIHKHKSHSSEKIEKASSMQDNKKIPEKKEKQRPHIPAVREKKEAFGSGLHRPIEDVIGPL